MTKHCLASLLAIEGDGFKILFIDNGSRGGSVAFLGEAPTCLTFLTRRKTAKYETVFRSYVRGNNDCANGWLLPSTGFLARWLSPVIFPRPLLLENSMKAWLHGWRQILFGRKLKLWVPIPGIATHLDTKALSPNVDWRGLMQQTVEAKV